MKKIFFMVVGLLFTASVVFASPNSKVEFATISKTDTQMLFGSESVDVVALSSDEMLATEGEWWSVFFYLGLSTISYLNAPSYDDKIYSGYPYQSRRGTKWWRWFL